MSVIRCTLIVFAETKRLPGPFEKLLADSEVTEIAFITAPIVFTGLLYAIKGNVASKVASYFSLF